MCKLKQKKRQTVTKGVKNKIGFTPMKCFPYKSTMLNVDFDTFFIVFTRVCGKLGQKYVFFVKFTKRQKLKI